MVYKCSSNVTCKRFPLADTVIGCDKADIFRIDWNFSLTNITFRPITADVLCTPSSVCQWPACPPDHSNNTVSCVTEEKRHSTAVSWFDLQCMT